MAIGGVVLNFAANTRGAIGDIRNLTRNVNNVGDAAKKSSGKIGGMSTLLKGGLAAGAALAGAGLVALGGFMVEAGKAAVEDKQSADKLAHTLSNVKGVTDDAIAANETWISSMQLATNVADTDLRDAVGKLTLATGDLTEAQKLTTLAVDVAAGSGKSLSSVTDILAKAVNGNTGALKKAFPWLDKNKDGAVDLDEALGGLQGAYKGAAKEAAKQDPWQTLKTIWDELKESAGAGLLPVLGELADWFADPKNRKQIQDMIDKVADLSTKYGTDAVNAIKDFVKYLKSEDGKAAVRDFTQLMKLLGAAMKVVWQQTKNTLDAVNALIRAWERFHPPKIPTIPGGGATPWSVAPTGMASRSTRAAPAPVYTQPPPLMVTEEQVFRAVSRLVMRGEARNGRLVVVG